MAKRSFRRISHARRRGLRRPRRSFRRRLPSLSRGPRMQVAFPPMLKVKLRYVETATTITSTTGTLSEHRLRANTTFDPDATDIGHQAKYRDQLFALYKKAVVLRSKVTAKLFNATSNSAAICGIHHDDNASSALSAISRAESRGAQWRVIPADTDSVVTLRANYNAAKHWGKNPLTNVNQVHTTSADPTDVHSFIVFYQTSDGASDTIHLAYQMDMEVVFFDLVELSTS